MRLFEAHRRTLEEGSAISPEVLEENDVRTITHGRELPEGFSWRQRKRGAGILFAVTRPNGKTDCIYRPDAMDPKSPGLKYEARCKALGSPGNVLAIPAGHRHLVEDVGVPVIFVEGIKKMLSVVSAARRAGAVVLVVAISGVWNWLSDHKPIADMLDIPMEGREVGICFDSDMARKPEVHRAAGALAEHLVERGAVVSVAYLADQADGSKTGADDFHAGGKSYTELLMTMRSYDPEDFAKVRLSRDQKLRAGVRWLRADWRDRDWMRFVGKAERGNWQRGHTARDTMEALIGLAAKSGKADERGIVVRGGLRRVSELAAKSAPSVGQAVKHLQEDGQLEILPDEDGSKARSYRLLVPRAALYSMERGHAKGEEFVEGTPRCKGLRAPSARRLRWSSPARLGRLVRRVEGATGRTVTEAIGENVFVPADYRPYGGRLGPHRGAVLDALEHAGGELHLEDLCEVLHRKRPRDVRRRILRPLEEAGIVECEGDVARLAADWLAKLDERREKDGEVEQAEKQAKRHERESAAYRLHLARKKRGTPKASTEAIRRSHALRDRRTTEAREEEERRRSPVPQALRDLVAQLVWQNGRIRMGLLRGIASEEGHHFAHVSRAVEELGLRVEELPEYGDAEFVFPPAQGAA